MLIRVEARTYAQTQAQAQAQIRGCAQTSTRSITDINMHTYVLEKQTQSRPRHSTANEPCQPASECT
eukprot:6207253-Pleurochrysis_carterae.AAC.2